ncbi:MAG: hypothetical protein ACYC2W_07425 [Desulfurivibrionaceae bacterium]
MGLFGQVKNNTGETPAKKTTAGILKDQRKLVNLNRLFPLAVLDGGGGSFLLTKKCWCIRGKGKILSFSGSNELDILPPFCGSAILFIKIF